MISKTNATTKIFCSAEHSDILITCEKRFILIIIMLRIDNYVVLIFMFLPAVKYQYETFPN